MRKITATLIMTAAIVSQIAAADSSSAASANSDMTNLQTQWGTDKRVFSDPNQAEVVKFVDGFFRENTLADRVPEGQVDQSSTGTGTKAQE